MTKSSAAKQAIFRQPHPLAQALLERLPARSRVLEVGPGSGRNLAALLPSIDVVALEADRKRAAALRENFAHAARRIVDGDYSRLPFDEARFAAVLSTHALLHGTPRAVQELLAEIWRVCRPGALLFATFGSQRDRRFGEGTRLADNCFAPAGGDEAGIAHSFFNGNSLRGLLPEFGIERLEEVNVDAIAGSWAHGGQPLSGAVHWFTVLRKPQSVRRVAPRR